ncbi:MAG: hypothetical protein Q4G47_03700 [Lachnospiraceae bacterium]|nr:hypothetical protein [Lachnospiraceae bacterium]
MKSTQTEVTAAPEPTETPLPIIIEGQSPVTITPIPVTLTPVADEEDYYKTIGERSDAETVLKIKLGNRTGKKIRKFCVYPSSWSVEDYGSNMLVDEDIFKNKEDRYLYYDTASDGGEDDLYYIRMIMKGGAVYILHDVPLRDIKEATLRLGDGYCYLLYTSASGKHISTEEHEKAVLKEQQALEEENRIKAEEEAAREEEERKRADKAASAREQEENDAAESYADDYEEEGDDGEPFRVYYTDEGVYDDEPFELEYYDEYNSD